MLRLNKFDYIFMQHPEPGYIPEVPFTPIWSQDAPPPIVPYPDLIPGFPCPDLGEFRG